MKTLIMASVIFSSFFTMSAFASDEQVAKERISLAQRVQSAEAFIKEKLKRAPKACELMPSQFGYLVVTSKKSYGPFASLLPIQDKSVQSALIKKVFVKQGSAVEFMQANCEMAPVDCQIQGEGDQNLKIKIQEGVEISYKSVQELLGGQVALEQLGLCNKFPVQDCKINESLWTNKLNVMLGEHITFTSIDRKADPDKQLVDLKYLIEMKQSLIDSGFCQDAQAVETCGVAKSSDHDFSISDGDLTRLLIVPGTQRVDDAESIINYRAKVAELGLCTQDKNVRPSCEYDFNALGVSIEGVLVGTSREEIFQDKDSVLQNIQDFDYVQSLTDCSISKKSPVACEGVISQNEDGTGFKMEVVATLHADENGSDGVKFISLQGDDKEGLHDLGAFLAMSYKEAGICSSYKTTVIEPAVINVAEIEGEVLVSDLDSFPVDLSRPVIEEVVLP